MKDYYPSYLECKRILNNLHNFQDLVCHDLGLCNRLKISKPLGKLIPESEDEKDKKLLIKRELNRLIPLIKTYLDFADIESEIVTSRNNIEFNFDKNGYEKKEIKEHLTFPHSMCQPEVE